MQGDLRALIVCLIVECMLSDSNSGKFNWKGTIKAVIRQSDDQELSVKKLKKKVRLFHFRDTHTVTGFKPTTCNVTCGKYTFFFK